MALERIISGLSKSIFSYNDNLSYLTYLASFFYYFWNLMKFIATILLRIACVIRLHVRNVENTGFLAASGDFECVLEKFGIQIHVVLVLD